jgi:hypothetical protein
LKDPDQLETTANTFAALDPILGFDYWKGNISNRGRYQIIAKKDEEARNKKTNSE